MRRHELYSPRPKPQKTVEIEIPHNFSCRPYQKAFFKAMADGCKRAVLVWHRRAGKEKACWNYMIMQATKKTGTYYYFFPTFSQGRKVLWDFIDKSGFRVLEHIPTELQQGGRNATEMKIRLKNGSLIQIIGTNNIDSIVGTNPVGCVFSEYSLQDPTAWTLMRPILVENGGWAVFNFTPRGQNHAKDIYDMAVNNPTWYAQCLTVRETKDHDNLPIITEKDIQAEREAGMSEDYIQQEFYCSFTLGIEGSYYAKNIQEAREEERIGNVPWDRTQRVYTAWDIGYGDATAIIFYQLCGQEIHIIDYLEHQGEGLPYYAKQLEEKPYLYDAHFAPHDIDSHAFSSGMSAREVGVGLGIRFIPLPTLKLKVEDGIESLRGIFPRIWIDAKRCKKLIAALENYRKEYDKDKSCYKSRPLHDWASHGADAARYLAIAIKTRSEGIKGVTNEEVERLMDKYQPRFNG